MPNGLPEHMSKHLNVSAERKARLSLLKRHRHLKNALTRVNAQTNLFSGLEHIGEAFFPRISVAKVEWSLKPKYLESVLTMKNVIMNEDCVLRLICWQEWLVEK